MSAGSAALGKGTFSVEASNGANPNPIRFEITYSVSGHLVATASVAKGSPLWDEYWFLDLKASRRGLEVMWSSGGSGCCQCDYIITAGPRGFVATGSNISPTYKADR